MLRQLLSSSVRRAVLTPLVARSQAYAVASSAGSKGADGGDAQKPKVLNNADIEIVDFDDPDYLPIPEYPFKQNETLEVRKARLVYQSRKRGMLENDLLLSTFVAKYLKDLDADQTAEYDKLINGVTNDWDIYYWATKTKPTPPEYENEIMRMLKEHVLNLEREQRLRQPDL